MTVRTDIAEGKNLHKTVADVNDLFRINIPNQRVDNTHQ